MNDSDVEWYNFIMSTNITEIIKETKKNMSYFTNITEDNTIIRSLIISNTRRFHQRIYSYWTKVSFINVYNAGLTVLTSVLVNSIVNYVSYNKVWPN